MALIWTLTKRDKQTKSEIYGILQQVGEALSNEFVSYIMERMKEYPHLSSRDLEFMYSFKNNSDLQNECAWKILNDAENYSENVLMTAFKQLLANISSSNMEKKLDFVNSCIQNLKKHKSSLIFIKAIRAIVSNTKRATAKVQNLDDMFDKARIECEEHFFKVSRN